MVEPDPQRGAKVVLILLALLTGAIWAFAEISDEVVEGETHGFDQRILLSLRDADDLSDPVGPKWVEEMGRDLTALGGVAILTLITVITAGYEFFNGRRATALLILLAVVGALLLSQGLKSAFDRPRPELVPHGSYVYTKSFPSGHSMLSAAVYLTVASLVARTLRERWARIYIFAAAVLLTFLVGISRVYLGVHWPTDVLAGWCGGAAWALVCMLIAQRLLRTREP
jgi:undecaprenyl-diphosphatase